MIGEEDQKENIEDDKEQQVERKYQIMIELLKREVQSIEDVNRQSLRN